MSVFNQSRHPDALMAFLGAMVVTSASILAYGHAAGRIHGFDPTPALETVIAFHRVAALAAPAIVAIKGAAVAAIVWAVAIMLDRRINYRACLTAVWTAEPIMMLPTLVAAVAAVVRGATKAQDLAVPLGLDVFWAPSAVPFAILSHSVNIFVLAWAVTVWFLVRRYAALEGRDWRVAFAVAVPACFLILAPVVQFVA